MINSITPPILVTGCPRSGTSMIAGIVSICGGFTGRVDRMWENIKIRERVIKPYFEHQLKKDPAGHYPLPTVEEVFVLEEWFNLNLRGRIKGILLEQGWDWQPWMYKDSRSLLIWPTWIGEFPDATWVIVRRREEDILNSCVKTGYMRVSFQSNINDQLEGDHLAEAWKTMIAGYLRSISEVKCSKARIFEVWPDKMVKNDFTEIEQMIRSLGLQWKPDQVKEFIQPKLWK
jgi:hypothetical protein